MIPCWTLVATSALDLAHCLEASDYAVLVVVAAVECPFVAVLENQNFGAWPSTLPVLVWARSQPRPNWIDDIQEIVDGWVLIVRHSVRVAEVTLNDVQWDLYTFAPCSFVALEWVGMVSMLSEWQSVVVVVSNIWGLREPIDAPCCRVHKTPSNPILHMVSILNEADPVTRNLDL